MAKAEQRSPFAPAPLQGLRRCRVGRGGAYRPASARSLKRLVQFSRKPLSYVGRADWRRLDSSGIRWRFPGLLDTGAGSFAERTYPHFRHLLTRPSSPDAATQYGAFPLRLVFWIQPASPLDGGDPEPFVLIPFKSTSPRSDSWHRIGRNFACAYIRTYRWPASGWALRSRLLALSSASVALFQPYLAFGRYQVSLSH
jgi:hypothetical protein